MARPGETARIHSKKQYDWFARALKHGLTGEFMPRRAGRDEEGNINSAGGGAPHSAPSPAEAKKVIDAFNASGMKREDLPTSGTGKDTPRNRERRPVVKGGRMVRPANRPDGTGTLERQGHIAAPAPAPARRARPRAPKPKARGHLGPAVGAPGGPKKKKRGWLKRFFGREENLEKYLSKSINENFNVSLDEALGI